MDPDRVAGQAGGREVCTVIDTNPEPGQERRILMTDPGSRHYACLTVTAPRLNTWTVWQAAVQPFEPGLRAAV